MNKIKEFFHEKRNLWIFGILIFLLLLLQFSPTLIAWLDLVLLWAADFIVAWPVLGLFIFVLISAASAVLSFFSSAVVVPVAVAAWGRFGTAILLLFGWILGGVFSYFLAYYLGKPIATKIVNKEKFEFYTNVVLKEATFPLVLLFRLAIPSEIGGLALGLLRYSFWKYLLATVITELPFAFILAYAGGAVLAHNFLTVIFYILAVLAVVALFGFVLRKYIIKYKNEHLAVFKKKDSRYP